MSEDELSQAANKLFDSISSYGGSEFPNSKDKLFASNKDYCEFNACISDLHGVHVYISGYEDAAKLLARVAIYSGRGIDTLVYPIIYLYRHSLEITLKDLIRKGCTITQTKPDDALQEALNKHNLMKLWNKFKPFFSKISGHNHDFEDVEKGIESYINQIHEIDPESLTFRYDKGIKNQEQKLSSVRHINILQFCNNVEKLTGLFDGVCAEFSDALAYVNSNND